MFDTRWRKTLRDAWRHRARTLLVVFAVALGLTGAGAVLDAWALVKTATRTGYAASHPVAATLNVSPLDAAFLERVRQLPGIGAVRARRTVVATLLSGGERKTAVLVALDDVHRPDIGRLQDSEGAWPPPDGAIVIERSSLGYSGARVGQDALLATAGNAPVAFRVAGVVRDVAVAPGWMDHVVHGFVSPSAMARLAATPDFDELQLTVSAPHPTWQEVRRLAWRVKALAEADGRRVGQIDVPEPGEHEHAAQMDSLAMVQGAFGVLTLLVCGTLIINLFTAMLAGQRRELGVMKAIGASEGQLAAQVLVLAAALGVLASAMALPLAALLGRRYASFQGELLNFPVDRYDIPPWALALQAAIGIVLPLLAAAWPAARACRQPVAGALRDTGLPSSTAGNRLRRWLQRARLARPHLVSLHNAFRQRTRCWLSLLALAVAGAVFVGAGNLRLAVRLSVDGLFAGQRHDMVLCVATPLPPLALEASVHGQAGVAEAEAWGRASAALALADGTVGTGFDLLAVPAASRMIAPSVTSGRWLDDRAPDGIVAGSALQKRYPGLRVGQRLPLVVDGRPVALRIAGFVDSGLEPVAYIARPAFASLRGADLASLLLVRAADRGQEGPAGLLRQLRSTLEQQDMTVAGGRLQSAARQSVEDHLQMVVSFLGMMGWVMIVVGGMGLASTMGVAVLERQREIGVLRAIGAGDRTVAGMVQLEGLVMALLGWLLSLPLSVPVSALLGDAFGRVMFTVPTALTPEPASALRWLLLVTLVSLLACAWPARQALRMPVVRALQYE